MHVGTDPEVRDLLTSFDLFDDASGVSTPAPRPGRCTRLIAALSSIAGLVLIANAAHPSVLRTLSTLELLGIVVLAVFPVLTLLALRLERRVARRDFGVWRDGAVCSQTRSTTHDAHERHARTRTRVPADRAHTVPTPDHGPRPGS